MSEVLDKLSELNATQREILTNQANQQKQLEKHSDTLEKQGAILLRNTITVEEHHRRSTYLETRQDLMEKDVSALKAAAHAAKSIKAFSKELVVIVGYVLTAITAIGGALWGMFKLLKGLGL